MIIIKIYSQNNNINNNNNNNNLIFYFNFKIIDIFIISSIKIIIIYHI